MEQAITEAAAHIALSPTNVATSLRFALYLTQAVCMIALEVIAVTPGP